MNIRANRRSPAVFLVVTLISMIAGAVAFNKVPPVLGMISSDLSIASNAEAGLLISIFVISGIILSIPMGAAITKVGPFKIGLLSIICIIAGSAIGTIAETYPIMLTSRVIEGIGLIFLSTLGPVIVAGSFPDKNRGSAMGLLMCFMTFGQIIAFNLAPIIATTSTWRNFWWIGTAIAIVALVLWIAFMRRSGTQPATEEGPANENAVAEKGSPFKDVLSNRGIWLICLVVFTYTLTHLGVLNYLPTYLTTVGQMSVTAAGSITSIACIVGIPVGILAGTIADKVGSRKIVLGILMLLLAVSFGILPLFTGATMVIFAIIYGVASMAQVGLCFTSVTSLVTHRESGAASALLNTFQWAGIFLSSILFGTLLDSFGWNTTFYILIPIAILGAILTFANKKLR